MNESMRDRIRRVLGRVFRFRFWRTRWGGVALFPARRFFWGVEFNFMTDSWDIHLCPLWFRIYVETFCRIGDRFREFPRNVVRGLKVWTWFR